ncbi:MAG: glucan biosynthesis protein [Deltaproteobacteria bacterium]|jgi:glucans biosynthesis protein|nr:glucan biosynthesis protein [Deltaproteobacteria bacterium]
MLDTPSKDKNPSFTSLNPGIAVLSLLILVFFTLVLNLDYSLFAQVAPAEETSQQTNTTQNAAPLTTFDPEADLNHQALEGSGSEDGGQPSTTLTGDSPTEAETDQTGTAPGFTFAQLEALAGSKTNHPFTPQRGAENKFLSGMREETWRSISYDSSQRLWGDDNSNFEVSFFHPGFIYDQFVSIHAVENGSVRTLEFSPHKFSYPEAGVKENAQAQALGFAGFSIHFPRNEASTMAETVIFLGANHFQAAARHSQFGQTARGLMINPGEPEGEEFPYFREFWLMKPQEGSNSMTIFALLESPRLVGAYEFVVTPGSSMSMQVRCSIFRRQEKPWPEKLGLAPITGMYLFSEKENGSPYDWRPELHTTDGLLYSDGPQSWFLRALNNPTRLMISQFELSRLDGFGLMQRDNNFDHYQDIGRRYDLRTWVWFEPKEAFPLGRIELIEIPNSREIHDNIHCFWSVKGADLGNLDKISLAYNLFWMPPASNPHTLGRVVSSRLLSRTSPEFVEFYLDFDNNVLNSITEVEGLASVVETGPQTPDLQRTLTKNPITGGWRLRLKLQAPEEPGFFSRLLDFRKPSASPQHRVQVRLVRGENLPLPLTETFVYDFPVK